MKLLIGIFLAIFLTLNTAHASYYQIFDEQENIVYTTGWKIRVGDELITADNKRYRIMQVTNGRGDAKLIGQVAMAPHYIRAHIHLTPIAHANDRPKVAIYHTHTDESYEPTDGTDSINGKGGIVEVGDSFATALEAHGIEVTHSDTIHNPHDDMAYERSRRTALNLIEQMPDAIFDVHRDATPPEAYAGIVSDEEVAKVQLVVGRYGATSEQIEEYALQLKAASDHAHPGLVKGIFFAKGGDYNQDLHPRSMLIEAGAHTNTREEAEKGIAMFADAIPPVLMRTAEAAGTTAEASGIGNVINPTSSGSMRSVIWIVGLAIAGGIVFLLISTGSIEEATAKAKHLITHEFDDVIGKNENDKNKK